MDEGAVVSLPVRNLGGRELYVESLSCDGNASFGIDASVVIPANASRFINVRYNPARLTSVVEKGLLSSNRGAVVLKLIGTGMRQAPYEKDIMNLVVTPGTTLRHLISNIMKEADWGQITELSVTGALSEEDVWTLQNLPNLRLLDLSTATVALEEPFWEALNGIAPQLEQLALPMNLSVLDGMEPNQFSKLTKLILPVGFQSLRKVLPEQLTSLILLSPEPPEIDYLDGIQFVNTIYVPGNVIESYRSSAWNQYQREILPITEEILSTDWTGGPILIMEDKIYDESNYPDGHPDILIQPDNGKGFGLTASLWNKAPLKAKSLTLGNQLIYRDRWSEEDLFQDESNYASFINENEQAIVDMVGYTLRCGKGNWYYLSFPFDFKLSEIMQEPESASEYVFRSYNGASRAINGLDQINNWTNVSSSDQLKAGQGYIFQCNGWDNQFSLFVNNANAVQSFMSTTIKTIPLEEHSITDPEK